MHRAIEFRRPNTSPAIGTMKSLRLPARPVPRPSLAASAALLGLGTVAALLAGVAPPMASRLALGALTLCIVLAVADLVRGLLALRRHPLSLRRQVPQVLPLNVLQHVELQVDNPGPTAWQGDLFDGLDPGFDSDSLPLSVYLPAFGGVSLRYGLRPLRRGAATLAPAKLRLRSPWSLWDLQVVAGAVQVLRVFPNFAAVSGYAWLAGQRRLAELGIKTTVARGLGTDFHSLADYRQGDPVRHVDWKASLRRGRPVVRHFQDERDQRVICLLDCGRRMRADEGAEQHGGSHFDHALNALMLLAYVALKSGDEVGVQTFGHAPGQGRLLSARKGLPALDRMMAALHDLQPGLAHSDYAAAATELMLHDTRRALVIVVTNCKDDDLPELMPALQLLGSRHLVLLASLRERALSDIQQGPIGTSAQAAEVATAHLFRQAREDAMKTLSTQHLLLVDVEPQHLAAALIERYQAVKATHRL